MSSKESHSGIYLLPNLFTTASLFAAFYSMVASLKMQYEVAAVAIFIGLIADGLDGRIARLTNTQTAFGAQYDSLSDMVTFGVAPSLLLYSWNLNQLGKIGWLVAFIYTAAVALRLARFNIKVVEEKARFFQGLPCPSAAAIVSAFTWISYQQELANPVVTVFTACITFTVALLMVSNVRYYSFKDIDSKGKVPFLYLLFMVTLFVAIAAYPSLVLFVGFSLYALSGPIRVLVKRRRKSRVE
jgi:CDP-diacylglycerol--serine O-phosphatidyltransferase